MVLRLASFGLLLACVSACTEDEATVEIGVVAQPLASVATTPPAGSESHAASRLRVRVREIRVHVAAVGEGRDTDEADAPAGFRTVFTGDRIIELSNASSVAELLGDASVPAGRLTQIRLVLDGAATAIDEAGAESALTCPSCDTSGLKIILRGGIRLEGGERRRLDVALDTARSIAIAADGQRSLVPVIGLAR